MNTDICSALFALQDVNYKQFHQKLVPTLDPARIIGVRTPEIRLLAKSIFQTPEAEAFLNCLPHRYYEENNLHACLLEPIKDYPTLLRRLEVFLPYIDNWATCDMLSPKIFAKNLSRLSEKLDEWLKSGYTYTVRFAIGMRMKYFLDDPYFMPEQLYKIAAKQSDEYYINMMVAWYFATALAKQFEHTIPIFIQGLLPHRTHNKAIQKAIESRRISDAKKIYLRTLKK